MSTDILQVKLSQDSLFFPLPFTNATIDNIVQVKNMLPVVQGDPRANVISYKILSAVHHRYSVRPPVGFIGAGEYTTIVFSFNPEHVRMAKNPAERELPTEATKDVIHIDFAVIDTQAAPSALAHWVPGKKETDVSREMMADASQFWKRHGQVKKNSPTAMCYKLRCVFATRNNAPDSLVMCMKEEPGKSKATADGVVSLPKTRPPVTSSTELQNTIPPRVLPPRHSDRSGTPSVKSSPSNDVSHVPRATDRPSILASRLGAVAPSSALPEFPQYSAKVPRPTSFPSTRCPAVTPKDIVLQVMNHTLSYKVVCVLLVLTVMCGLWDSSNLLTWLIIR
ncbi:hypothetical protein JKF63_03391 [Porcisia hertigi]|uniref:MSP domain-containing protein n=1 Tax=Porcisia hertigi TaxID=2761500 RepID=A0A836L794_9TRYP|nr:hypothetical protein JKF63_03391 [Porcisia hertigi]